MMNDESRNPTFFSFIVHHSSFIIYIALRRSARFSHLIVMATGGGSSRSGRQRYPSRLGKLVPFMPFTFIRLRTEICSFAPQIEPPGCSLIVWSFGIWCFILDVEATLDGRKK